MNGSLTGAGAPTAAFWPCSRALGYSLQPDLSDVHGTGQQTPDHLSRFSGHMCTHGQCFLITLSSSTNSPRHWDILAEQMEAFPNLRGGVGHMDVSTAYSRWPTGLLSRLLWAPIPLPWQPQHGVHLSMMKALRTGLSGTPERVQSQK